MDVLTRTGTAATATFYAQRHHEAGCWWADSDQLPGWTAAANDEDELWRLVSEAPAAVLGWPEGEYNIVLRGA